MTASASEDTVLLASDRPFGQRLCPHQRDDAVAVRAVRTPVGDRAWLVTGVAEIRSLLVDPRLGRSHPDPAAMPKYAGNPLYDMVISDDHDTADAIHENLRRLIKPHFTSRRMLALRPRIGTVVADALDALGAQRPPAELNSRFSEPVVLEVICELLGVPPADREHCVALISRVEEKGIEQAGGPSEDSLLGYLRTLIGRKRSVPAVDVISGLCESGASDEDVAQMALFLLFAGFGSTVKQIAYGLLLLADNPGQRELLVKDPTGVPIAVEEMLRMAGSPSLPRYARQDIEIGGATIRRDDLVLLDLAQANFDECEFDRPDTLDVARRANRHLSFSHGAWTCLGAPLARVILQEVFTGIFTRLPTLTPTLPASQLALTDTPLAGGLADEFPVTW